jgi:hypothetical protein
VRRPGQAFESVTARHVGAGAEAQRSAALAATQEARLFSVRAIGAG